MPKGKPGSYRVRGKPSSGLKKGVKAKPKPKMKPKKK